MSASVTCYVTTVLMVAKPVHGRDLCEARSRLGQVEEGFVNGSLDSRVFRKKRAGGANMKNGDGILGSSKQDLFYMVKKTLEWLFILLHGALFSQG